MDRATTWMKMPICCSRWARSTAVLPSPPALRGDVSLVNRTTRLVAPLDAFLLVALASEAGLTGRSVTSCAQLTL